MTNAANPIKPSLGLIRLIWTSLIFMGSLFWLAAFSLKPLINLEQRSEKACKVMAGHVIKHSALIGAG